MGCVWCLGSVERIEGMGEEGGYIYTYAEAVHGYEYAYLYMWLIYTLRI